MKKIIILLLLQTSIIGTIFSQGGLGNVVLPGNATCDSQYISVSPCNGVTSITYNGHDYDLVEIGGQCWFKENLQTTKYRDGSGVIYPGLDTSLWMNDTIGSYTWYDYDSITYASTYGALYNWYAVNNPKGLCPSGWHVATDCEWMYMEDTLGMSTADQEFLGSSGRGTDEGDKLKEVGTTLWPSPNTGTNSSGFTALPCGYVNFGQNFSNVNYSTTWWTSSGATPNLNGDRAWTRSVFSNYSNISRHTIILLQGYSVRCIKDSTSIQTSLKEIQNFRALNIYPNPFTTSTTIELPNAEPHTLSIYDIVGNKVREEKVSGKTIIERGDLKSGVYIIELSSVHRKMRGKVIVK